MVEGKFRGAVCFTSSPAWMLPSPTAAMSSGGYRMVLGVAIANHGLRVTAAINVYHRSLDPAAANANRPLPVTGVANVYQPSQVKPAIPVQTALQAMTAVRLS